MKSQGTYIGLQLYIITLLFTALSIFLQILPLSTSEYFEQSLAINSSTFVYLTSAFFITYSVMQLPGGVFFDRYGIKIILPAFICITAFGIILYWFSYSGSMILISRLIAGLGCSIAYISAIYVAARFFPPQRLSILIGLIEASSTLGTLVATRPLKYIISLYGWHVAGIIISVFCLLLSLIAFICMRNLGNNVIVPNKSITLAKTFKNAFLLLKNKNLLYIFLYSFCTWLVIMSFAGYWLKDYMQNMHNYTEAKALWLVEIYWMSFLISSILIGAFIKQIETAKKALVALATLGFIAYVYMFTPVLFTYSHILMVLIAGGISATGVIIAFSMLPQYVKPEQCGSAVAMNNTFVVLGGYIGQILFATILKSFDINQYIKIIKDPMVDHQYYSALIIYVFFTFMGLVFAILIARNKPMVITT